MYTHRCFPEPNGVIIPTGAQYNTHLQTIIDALCNFNPIWLYIDVVGDVVVVFDCECSWWWIVQCSAISNCINVVFHSTILLVNTQLIKMHLYQQTIIDYTTLLLMTWILLFYIVHHMYGCWYPSWIHVSSCMYDCISSYAYIISS